MLGEPESNVTIVSNHVLYVSMNQGSSALVGKHNNRNMTVVVTCRVIHVSESSPQSSNSSEWANQPDTFIVENHRLWDNAVKISLSTACHLTDSSWIDVRFCYKHIYPSSISILSFRRWLSTTELLSYFRTKLYDWPNVIL